MWQISTVRVAMELSTTVFYKGRLITYRIHSDDGECYTAYINKPTPETDESIPKEIVLRKQEGEWQRTEKDDFLTLTLRTVIDRHNK